MLIKIWERYFLWETLKTSLFFIFCFYALYALVDYASHTGNYHGIHFPWHEVVFYYLYEFSTRLEVLLPFALLLGTVRTLCSLNVHHELIALQSCGMSLQRLMCPLIGLGLLSTGLLYLNMEYVAPTALQRLSAIHDTRSEKKVKLNRKISAQHLVLNDGSRLIFQNYNPTEGLFFDVYWIKSIDDIVRMQYLTPNFGGVATGYLVDHIKRDANHQLVVVDSKQEEGFSGLQFNQTKLREKATSADELALSDLWDKLSVSSPAASEKEAQVVAAFYQKMILPWFCLLAVLGPAPFCLRVTRNLPIFFIYAGSIFALVSLYLIIDAAALLSKRQVLPAVWAVTIPFGCIVSWIGFRFYRM